MKNKEVTINQNNRNLQQLHSANNQQNLEEQAILSNDECNCKYCSAVYIIHFGYPAKFYIPISEKEFNELFFSNENSFYNRFKQQRIGKENTVFIIK